METHDSNAGQGSFSLNHIPRPPSKERSPSASILKRRRPPSGNSVKFKNDDSDGPPDSSLSIITRSQTQTSPIKTEHVLTQSQITVPSPNEDNLESAKTNDRISSANSNNTSDDQVVLTNFQNSYYEYKSETKMEGGNNDSTNSERSSRMSNFEDDIPDMSVQNDTDNAENRYYAEYEHSTNMTVDNDVIVHNSRVKDNEQIDLIETKNQDRASPDGVSDTNSIDNSLQSSYKLDNVITNHSGQSMKEICVDSNKGNKDIACNKNSTDVQIHEAQFMDIHSSEKHANEQALVESNSSNQEETETGENICKSANALSRSHPIEIVLNKPQCLEDSVPNDEISVIEAAPDSSTNNEEVSPKEREQWRRERRIKKKRKRRIYTTDLYETDGQMSIGGYLDKMNDEAAERRRIRNQELKRRISLSNIETQTVIEKKNYHKCKTKRNTKSYKGGKEDKIDCTDMHNDKDSESLNEDSISGMKCDDKEIIQDTESVKDYNGASSIKTLSEENTPENGDDDNEEPLKADLTNIDENEQSDHKNMTNDNICCPRERLEQEEEANISDIQNVFSHSEGKLEENVSANGDKSNENGIMTDTREENDSSVTITGQCYSSGNEETTANDGDDELEQSRREEDSSDTQIYQSVQDGVKTTSSEHAVENHLKKNEDDEFKHNNETLPSNSVNDEARYEQNNVGTLKDIIFKKRKESVQQSNLPITPEILESKTPSLKEIIHHRQQESIRRSSAVNVQGNSEISSDTSSKPNKRQKHSRHKPKVRRDLTDQESSSAKEMSEELEKYKKKNLKDLCRELRLVRRAISEMYQESKKKQQRIENEANVIKNFDKDSITSKISANNFHEKKTEASASHTEKESTDRSSDSRIDMTENNEDNEPLKDPCISNEPAILDQVSNITGKDEMITHDCSNESNSNLDSNEMDIQHRNNKTDGKDEANLNAMKECYNDSVDDVEEKEETEDGTDMEDLEGTEKHLKGDLTYENEFADNSLREGPMYSEENETASELDSVDGKDDEFPELRATTSDEALSLVKDVVEGLVYHVCDIPELKKYKREVRIEKDGQADILCIVCCDKEDENSKHFVDYLSCTEENPALFPNIVPQYGSLLSPIISLKSDKGISVFTKLTIRIPFMKASMKHYQSPNLYQLDVTENNWRNLASKEYTCEDEEGYDLHEIEQILPVLEADIDILAPMGVVAAPIVENFVFDGTVKGMSSSVDQSILVTSSFSPRFNAVATMVNLTVLPISNDVIEDSRYSRADDARMLASASSLIKVDLLNIPPQAVTLYLPCDKPKHRPWTAQMSSRLSADSGFCSASRIKSRAKSREAINNFLECWYEAEIYLVRIVNGSTAIKQQRLRNKDVNNDDKVVLTCHEKTSTFLIVETKKEAQHPNVISITNNLISTLESQRVLLCVLQRKDDVNQITVMCELKSRLTSRMQMKYERDYFIKRAVFSIREGEKVKLGIRGNICNIPHQELETRFYAVHGIKVDWKIKVIDLYSQRSLPTFCGFIQLQTQNDKSDTFWSRNAQEKGSWKRLIDVPVTLPKFRATISASITRVPLHLRHDGPITVEFLISLAKYIGHEWYHLSRALHLDHARVQSIIQQNRHRGHETLVKDVLLTWLKRSPHSRDKAQSLIRALNRCGRYDLADEIKSIDRSHKKEQYKIANDLRLEKAFETTISCTTVTQQWFRLSQCLGVKERKTSEIFSSKHDDKRKCLAMLLEWKKSRPYNNQRKLVQSLRQIGCNCVADHLVSNIFTRPKTTFR